LARRVTGGKQEILETVDLDSRVKKSRPNCATRWRSSNSPKDRHRSEGCDGPIPAEICCRAVEGDPQELGESEGKATEFDDLKKKIAAAKMSEQAEQEALKSVARLERMAEGAPEYSMVRSHLDWLLDLPWNITTEENIDLAKARAVLDADHHDLAKVKKRLIQFLAVRKLNPQGKVRSLVGPPGVGKTSLGQSIATAMNRNLSGRVWAVCMMRPRSRSSAHLYRRPAGSNHSGPSAPAPRIRCSCSTDR
jgi:ATP-dependent Lon protease